MALRSPPKTSVLVPRWLLDLIDDHHFHRRLSLLHAQSQLLLHRAKKARRRSRNGGSRLRAGRRTTSSAPERPHSGIGRELENERVARIAESRLVNHRQIHELRLHHARKFSESGVANAETPRRWPSKS